MFINSVGKGRTEYWYACKDALFHGPNYDQSQPLAKIY